MTAREYALLEYLVLHRGRVIGRTELYEHLRDYTVLVDEKEKILGCCALHSAWDGLAELKALAVHDEAQGNGWGRKLVDAALSEAGDLDRGRSE